MVSGELRMHTAYSHTTNYLLTQGNSFEMHELHNIATPKQKKRPFRSSVEHVLTHQSTKYLECANHKQQHSNCIILC